MKQQLDELNRQAMSLITEFAEKNDPVSIASLASTASRIRQLSNSLDEIQNEIPRLTESLRQFEPGNPDVQMDDVNFFLGEMTKGRLFKSPRKKLRVEIDWARAGLAKKGKEVIEDHLASTTLTKFVTRLHQELGEHVLTTLSGLRINRGPFVSKNPQKEFLNYAQGSVYQHQQIPDTDYYVLTQSNTTQKVGDIQRAARALKLPIGAVTVIEVEK